MTTITPHAARAATRLQEECGMMGFMEDEAEAIVQEAIDAARAEWEREEKKADGKRLN